MVLKGENAAAYVAEVKAAFTPNLPVGMQKIAAAMERAETTANIGQRGQT